MGKLNTDLRKQKVQTSPSGTQAAQSRIANLPGFRGALPLPQGGVVNRKVFTEYEKKLLKEAGWKEGEPVPGTLASIIAEEQKRIAAEMDILPVSPDTKPFKPPTLVNFSDLSPEKQQQLMEEIRKAKDQLSVLPPMQGAGPGINEALAIAQQPSLEVVDSRKQEFKQEIPELPDNPFKEDTKNSIPSAGGDAQLVNCPHCGWQLDIPDVEATTEDKYSFMQSILGQIRFKKTYPLFGGKMHVTFRSLTSEESDMVYRQLSLDIKNNKIDGMSDYYQFLMYYRIVCGLEKLDSDESGPIDCPEVSEYQLDGPDPKNKTPDTPLVEVTKLLLKEVLKHESIRRVLVAAFARFTRLIEHLEARIEDADFWSATEVPH